MQFNNNQAQFKCKPYNPLFDPYLNQFFEKKYVINNLKRHKIINKKGDIVDLRLVRELQSYQIEHNNQKQDNIPIQTILNKIQSKKYSVSNHSRAENDILPKIISQNSQFTQHLKNTYLRNPDQMFKKKIRSQSFLK